MLTPGQPTFLHLLLNFPYCSDYFHAHFSFAHCHIFGSGSALDVLAPRTHSALIGSTTLVPCSFTVGSPPINHQFLAILWQYGEKELVRYDNKEKSASPRMSINEKEAKQGNASLTINNVTIADQGKYKCLIIYSPMKGMKEIQVDIQGKQTGFWNRTPGKGRYLILFLSFKKEKNASYFTLYGMSHSLGG